MASTQSPSWCYARTELPVAAPESSVWVGARGVFPVLLCWTQKESRKSCSFLRRTDQPARRRLAGAIHGREPVAVRVASRQGVLTTGRVDRRELLTVGTRSLEAGGSLQQRAGHQTKSLGLRASRGALRGQAERLPPAPGGPRGEDRIRVGLVHNWQAPGEGFRKMRREALREAHAPPGP